MKRKVICIFVLSSLILMSFTFSNQAILAHKNSINPESLPSINQTPHDPIVIANDSNFTDYGFAGIGTSETPFVIESLSIITFTNDTGIYINGTTKHFVIRNCFVAAYRNGIIIENASNGTVTLETNTCNGHRDYGIKIYNSHNVTILHNISNSNQYYNGITLERSEEALLMNNTCNFNNNVGIYLEYSPNATLIDNLCQANNRGIDIEKSENANLTSNTISNNNYVGITIDESTRSILSYNNCSFNHGSNIYIDDSPYTSIVNNTCNNSFQSRGLMIAKSDNSRIINNTCMNNDEESIYFYNTISIELINNTFEDGIQIDLDTLEEYLGCKIENNRVNGKLLGYFLNEDDMNLIDPVYAQLFLINCTNINISNQELSTIKNGIEVGWSTNITISNIACNNNEDNGISIFYSNNTIISDSFFNNNGNGIKIVESRNIVLTNNIASNNIFSALNGHGIAISSSEILELVGNTCNNNEFLGIYIEDSTTIIMTNNTCLENGGGIFIEDSEEVELKGNKCNYNNGNGIYLSIVLDSRIEDNQCNYNGNEGMYLTGANNATVESNKCNNNVEAGIYVFYSPFSVLENNLCNNNENGIYCTGSYFAQIINNTCNENTEYGIYISGGREPPTGKWVIISNNTIKQNNYGIYLMGAWYCQITFNTIQENTLYGIAVDGVSQENVIHHNFFIDNNLGGTSQAYDNYPNNTWYDEITEEGNYWSGWDKKKPYRIDGDVKSKDLYPLNESMERINYQIATVVFTILGFVSIGVYIKRKNKVKCKS